MSLSKFLVLILIIPLAAQAEKRSGELKESLVEQSPLIDEVEIIKGDNFLEVFVSGTSETDCYEFREYEVEKKENFIQIIARFRTAQADKVCTKLMKNFREKVADLDANDPRSRTVKVLGYNGWHTATFALPKPEPAK